MLNIASLSTSLPGIRSLKKMDDKVVRYTVLFGGVGVCGFILYMIYQVFLRINADATMLNNLVSAFGGVVIFVVGFVTRHQTTKKQDKQP